MKIICTTTFLDGRERFEVGETRIVDDARGAYFVANGWASADGAPASGGESGAVDLIVHDTQHAHKEVTRG